MNWDMSATALHQELTAPSVLLLVTDCKSINEGKRKQNEKKKERMKEKNNPAESKRQNLCLRALALLRQMAASG